MDGRPPRRITSLMPGFLRQSLAAAVTCLLAHAAPVPLFDGKSFDGWEGDTTKTWRIENGAIHGGSMEGNPRNEFLATGRSFRNFVLTFEYKLVGTEGFVNGGVQFHSQRMADPAHEMSGYQADIGAGYTGFLYDESRRNKMLAEGDKDQIRKIENPGEWNRYEIRAEGDRIRLSVNGTLTVDYTERDPAIPLEGRIGLQIHGDCKAVISYRNLLIEELPDHIVPDQTQILRRFGDPATGEDRPMPWRERVFDLARAETIVFTGQTNLVREQKAGNLEARLSVAHLAKKPVFRSMAWEADTVHEQWRDLNFGSWEDQLSAVGATVVVAQFGQIESLDGTDKLPRFIADYHRLLDRFAAVTPRLVLISPMPFEKPLSSHAPDLTERNDDVKAYSDAIADIARLREAVFVDIFTPLSARPAGSARLTDNGMHLTDEGLQVVSKLIAGQLGAAGGSAPSASLLQAIAEKNRLWFDSWRPANWSFVYGDRISQRFGKGGGGAPSLRQAFEQHKPLIRTLDSRIQALAGGDTPPDMPHVPQPDFNPADPLTPEQQMAGFTLADGYEVNLFASEELGVTKPVQMSWDEKGRLHIACSPTYPQTLPGIAPSDYILVVEDTDGDGRADISTRFAEGLTMVQGVEPGNGGVYVCDFDRILHFRDTDGDGKGDHHSVLLSGFGVGDTHQLVNSISHGPNGDLWFTQGLHAFSRVETPWGVRRLDKAGVWRFNPRTLLLDGFFNGGTAGHNCWGVAFDDYNQIFHKSGDRPHGYYSLPGLIRLSDPDDYHSVATLFDSSPKTTALEFIGTRALPDELQGAALIGGYFGSLIEVHRLMEDGAGFKSEQLPRLLTSSNDSFRPVDVSVGPDGAIYVADWFNPVIGHYQASYADRRRDRSHGRIWRISASDRPAVKQPDLAAMSSSELLDQLRSPERWTRDQAKRLLFYRPSAETLAAADQWLADLDPGDPDFEKAMLELTGIFEAHQAPRPGLLDRLLSAADPRVRAYGTRVISTWNPASSGSELLSRSINDSHPRVRLEAIVACADLQEPEAVAIALQALDHPRDRFIDYALKHTIRALQPHWQPLLDDGALPLGDLTHETYLREIATAAPIDKHPGELIYETLCLNCHQPGGKGLAGVYPPLTPNEWVSGDPTHLIKILLHGLSGPIAVAGTDYGIHQPLPMPPMGLDDKQIADVLTYIRTNFGNQSAPVAEHSVSEVREATTDRSTFWTMEDLTR